MHRIDGDGATNDNRFTSGNPQAGIPATVITQEWLNSIQEELVSVIGAEKLDKSQTNQLLKAIQAMTAGQDVGKLALRIVDPSNLPTLAPNELVPMGQLLNRADYPELWEYIQASGAMVSDSVWQQSGREAFFSSGNGSTTFRPGNLVTGVFPRFLDLTGLYDPDRNSRVGGNVPGSWQGDAIRNITGSFHPSFNTLGSAGIVHSDSSAVGAFKKGNSEVTRALGIANGYLCSNLEFDASRSVPTASDNRPVSIAILPTYIYK
ncbi:hypothetical protein [Endozoicomonas sp. ALB115]|uniref:hypothetical protein n=1 Tax=Endozoicomonas sp. ALB115 TaxID=3403074 RepID=UPI003BB6B98F